MSPTSSPYPATASVQRSASMYAEFLPKLGRLSILVHLPTPSNPSTKALIAKDASRLIVTHEGVVSELPLPVKPLLPRSDSETLLPVPPSLEKLSWALRPDPARLVLEQESNPDTVPWSAADLPLDVHVVCRTCGQIVVGREKLEVWKDLPSENWAEMMEFWHCHKPTTTNGSHDNNKTSGAGEHQEGDENGMASEEKLSLRGYGANSAIVAQPGVGFVDLTTMLFYPEDCRCLTASENNESKSASSPATALRPSAALCPGCRTQLGHLDNRKAGICLFKWKLNLTKENIPLSNAPPPPPTLSQCLAAALVANQARSGSAKVVLQGKSQAITTWVLNPHIKFSCLSQGSSKKAATSAMKLLYQDKAMDEEDEIYLPDEAIEEIRATLQEGNRYLPPDEKEMKRFGAKQEPWMVTLLER